MYQVTQNGPPSSVFYSVQVRSLGPLKEKQLALNNVPVLFQVISSDVGEWSDPVS